MRISRYWTIATLLGVSVFCESMAYTYIQQQGATYFYSSSLLYFFAGIAICILPLFSSEKTDLDKTNTTRAHSLLPYLFYIFLAGLFIWHVVMLSGLYKSMPIDKKWADMLPVIQLSCKRFLHGLWVYALTNEIKPGSINAYLPMMWMPYVPAEIFKYDYRWTTITSLFISLFIAALPLFRPQNKIAFIPMFITGLSLFMVLNFFIVKEHIFWGMTEEGTVAAFYLLLAYALLSENYYLTGIAMAFCLLSRYSLVFWIPVYFGYVFLSMPRNVFLKILMSFTSAVTLLFVLPYFIWDPLYFLKLPGVQGGGFDWYWKCAHLDENRFYNVGLYKFFNISQVWLMAKIEVVTSILSPTIFIVLAKKMQQRYSISNRFIAFGSLKISLVCFYNFIPTPYPYLFFPVTLISYAVLFDFIASQRANK